MIKRKNSISNEIDSSFQAEEKVVKRFIAEPDFPFLISFPRTGSHWLRMLMEIYFKKPSLARIFYYENAADFTCYHRHDEDLAIQRQNVIYLYRCPIETIYSQLNYYQEDIYDAKRVEYWAQLYGSHLKKWLLEETFTTQKTVVTFEGMKKRMEGEFIKICNHFSVPFNRKILRRALAKVTKAEVKRKTRHDQRVINLSSTYRVEKEKFKKRYSSFIMDCVYSTDKELKELITSSNCGKTS